MRVVPAGIVGFFLWASSTAMSQNPPSSSDVFVGGQGGFPRYRIPSLVVSNRGTLLAFCSGQRLDNPESQDSGSSSAVLRRSSDGGKTWGPLQVVWDPGPNYNALPTPVVDRQTGTIWLLYFRQFKNDTFWELVGGTNQEAVTAWISRSTDDGATWSPPQNITSSVKAPDWRLYIPAPGVGIQTSGGRLVIPGTHSVGSTQNITTHVNYSDDHGATWKIGGSVSGYLTEPQVVERVDGSLLMNMRNQWDTRIPTFTTTQQRALSTSANVGLTWSAPTWDPVLTEPHYGCQGSIARYTRAPQFSKNRLIFSVPSSLGIARTDLKVWMSYDEGKTWPVSKLLRAGSADYSSLVTLPDMNIGCLHEHGTGSTRMTHITFTRFSLDWLTDGADSLMTSPPPPPGGFAGWWKLDETSGLAASDASGNGHPGTLKNGPVWTAGKVGGALGFDGANDHVTVAASGLLNVATDHTVAAWIRPDTTSGTRNIYAQGRSTNTVQRFSFAVVGGRIGYTVINDADSGFEDYPATIPAAAWTHVALTRKGTGYVVYVNGVPFPSTRTASGTYTFDRSTIGAIERSTVLEFFDGAIDDVRLYPRALSTVEIQTLAGAGSGIGAHWKLDETGGSTASDSSGNGHTGILKNGPVWTSGRIGGALALDGINDHVNVAIEDIVDVTSSYSICAWIRTGSGASTQTVYGQGKSTNTVQRFSFGLMAGKVGYSLLNDADSGISDFPAPVTPGVWTHVALTKTGTSYVVYVNGTAFPSTRSTAGTYTFDRSTIGSIERSTVMEFFDGAIDDIRLYARALLPTEIQALVGGSAMLLSAAGIADPSSGPGGGKRDGNACGLLGLEAVLAVLMAALRRRSLTCRGPGDGSRAGDR